jgi:glycosyltransferase involved in cell wall biosynthesis
LAVTVDFRYFSGGRWAFIKILQSLRAEHDIELLSSNGFTQNIAGLPSVRINTPVYKSKIINFVFLNFVTPFLTVIHTIRELKRLKPDMVLVNQGYLTFPLVMLSVFFKKIPFLVYAQDAFNLRSLSKYKGQQSFFMLLSWFNYIFGLRFYKHIIVNSYSTQKILSKECNIPKSKISFVGVPLEIPKVEQNRSTKPLVVNISRLAWNKRPFDFIKIAKKVNKSMAVDFVWVGVGRLLDMCKQTAKNSVDFSGAMTDIEKTKMLKKAWILLSTSETEGFNMVIGEALLCKRPVVAYDLEVYKDVYGKRFESVPLFDVDAASEKIINIINDYGFYSQKVEENEQFVSKTYSSSAIAERINDVIKSIKEGNVYV